MNNQVVGLIVIILLIGVIVLAVWKGKNLLKMQFFQQGLFKQAKFMFSSPERPQGNIVLSETGTIGFETMPLHTGFETSLSTKRTWMVLHALKFKVYKNGKPYQDEPVLLITERSYLPLDPNSRLTTKEKAKLASLKDIARLKHAEALSMAGRPNDGNDFMQSIIAYSFMLDAFFGILALIIRKFAGGG